MTRYKSLDQAPEGLRRLYEEQYGHKRQTAPCASPPAKRSKYGNVRTEFNGETYDSKAQAADSQRFVEQAARGEIGGYAREVSIPLAGHTGKRRSRMQLDHLVNERRPHTCSACGHVDSVMQLIFKDTKGGHITREWETKRRIVEAQLGIRIEIIQH